jgi:hypothetical protein
MQLVFEHGNLNGLTRDGWVIGHFASPPRHALDVEVKWAYHERGSLQDKPWSQCETATTLAVLISGRFEIKFQQAPEDVVVLTRPGDYVLFGPRMPHKPEALDDCVFLTIRWPSVGGDCKAPRTE